MVTFIIICLVILAIPVYILFSWHEIPKVRPHIIRAVYIINIVFLYPCIYLTFTKMIQYDPLNWVWSHAFLGSTMMIVFLRCFFMPYILSVIWTIIYIRELNEKNYPKLETALFAVMLILMIMGLVSVEDVFNAAMGI